MRQAMESWKKNKNRIPTDAEIDRTIEYFSAKSLLFIWWTSTKVLETKGFQFGGILTGIALDISHGVPPKPATFSNLKIATITPSPNLQPKYVLGTLRQQNSGER